MATYQEEVVAEKQYVGNVVVRLNGKYFSIRRPDAGLYIPYPRSECVANLVLNPTQVNPKTVTTTIASYGFKLVDKEEVISKLVKDRGADLLNQDVDIWLGRSGTGMSFADYYKLPTTKLSKILKTDAGYTVSTRETTERINRPLYDLKIRLQGDILALTTEIISKDDIASFPNSGAFFLDGELIEYTAKNNTTRTFSNCGRGAFGTLAADHSDNDDIYQAELLPVVNPVDLILMLLVSGGGGGAYDILDKGLAISESLIDVTAIEAIRDDFFPDDEFSFALYNIDSVLKFIEKEILQPCNLRFTYARDTGKLTLATLDRPAFTEEADVIDHDSITQHPQLEIADTEIVNSVEVSYAYSEGTRKYLELAKFEDEESVSKYGPMVSPFKVSFKGVQDYEFVERFARNILGRLALPAPQIQVRTHINKSLLGIGDKPELRSSLLPSDTGELNFANTVEVLSRSINWQSGDVTLKLAYTSTSGYRLCYIAPSDRAINWLDASGFEIPAGQGTFWRAGWKVRLFDKQAVEYVSAQVNTIEEIIGDHVFFSDAWAGVTLEANRYTLKFADYDDVTLGQKKYCFVGVNDAPFSRSEKPYSIVP